MSLSDTTENALLNLIYSATAWANYADNAASVPQTNIAVALHTADPGDAGTQSTSEAAYTSYTRASVARSTGFSTASGTGGTTSPASAITFTAGTGGSGTDSFFSTGKSGGGATAILHSGTITPNIVSGAGVTPQLSTATTLTLD